MSEVGLLRSSSVMAVGTISSRLTGMLRTIALVAAVGTGVFADTYYNANILPTIIYTLFIGGAINAVFVPQLVRHMKDDADEGAAYAQRLFTAVGIVLAVTTVLAVILAPVIVRLYSSGWNERELEVATAFARFMLPQIFFFGVFTVLSQILNSRSRFGPPMFAPVVNNLVTISIAVMFLVVAGTGTTTRTVTDNEIMLLGVGTTLGTVAQVAVLLPFFRRTGVSLLPRFDLKGQGLGKAWSLARWTIALVLINQIGSLFLIRLATAVNVNDKTLDSGSNVYGNAYLLFMLPQSVITVSIVTALLPHLSRLAHDHEWETVRERLGWALRTTCSVIVPAAAVLIAFGPVLGLLLFGFGSSGAEGGTQIGLTAAMFAVGLPAFSAYYTLMRGYYALEDTRSPTINALLLNAVNVALAYALVPVVPAHWKIPVLGLAFALAYWVALVPLWVRLRRRLSGLQTPRVVRTFVRVVIATTLATLVAVGCFLAVRGVLGQPEDQRWSQAVALAVALGAGGAVYLGLARLMRVEELRPVLMLVRGRRPA